MTKPAWYLLCWTSNRVWLMGPYRSRTTVTEARKDKLRWSAKDPQCSVVHLADAAQPLIIVPPDKPSNIPELIA